jgi:hypothetical protein
MKCSDRRKWRWLVLLGIVTSAGVAGWFAHAAINASERVKWTDVLTSVGSL